MHWFGVNYRMIVVFVCILASASLAIYFSRKSTQQPWAGLYAKGFFLICIGCAFLFVDFLFSLTGVLALVRKGLTISLCLLGLGLTVLGEKRKRQISRLE